MFNSTIFTEQLNHYYAVWQECNYVYEEWAKAHGLSVNSLLILSAIREGGEDCTQKNISQRWLIPKQTVNMILKDLEKRGMVALSPSQQDKRNKRISFTPAGVEYADSVISKLRKVELFVLEEMGLERIKQLNENMSLFVELFSKAGGKENNETDV